MIYLKNILRAKASEQLQLQCCNFLFLIYFFEWLLQISNKILNSILTLSWTWGRGGKAYFSNTLDYETKTENKILKQSFLELTHILSCEGL